MDANISFIFDDFFSSNVEVKLKAYNLLIRNFSNEDERQSSVFLSQLVSDSLIAKFLGLVACDFESERADVVECCLKLSSWIFSKVWFDGSIRNVSSGSLDELLVGGAGPSMLSDTAGRIAHSIVKIIRSPMIMDSPSSVLRPQFAALFVVEQNMVPGLFRHAARPEIFHELLSAISIRLSLSPLSLSTYVQQVQGIASDAHIASVGSDSHITNPCDSDKHQEMLELRCMKAIFQLYKLYPVEVGKFLGLLSAATVVDSSNEDPVSVTSSDPSPVLLQYLQNWVFSVNDLGLLGSLGLASVYGSDSAEKIRTAVKGMVDSYGSLASQDDCPSTRVHNNTADRCNEVVQLDPSPLAASYMYCTGNVHMDLQSMALELMSFYRSLHSASRTYTPFKTSNLNTFFADDTAIGMAVGKPFLFKISTDESITVMSKCRYVQ